MPKSEVEIDLRSIVYPEHGQWIAHCLELDIVAQGETIEKALSMMVELCEYQIQAAMEDGDLESILRPAPPKFWQLYFAGTRRKKSRKQLAPPLNRIDTREMVPA